MGRVRRRPYLCPATSRAQLAQQDEWAIGLRAAGLLRRTFPEFRAEHVAHRLVTADGLLSAGVALISLAESKVELSDYGVDHLGGLTTADPFAILDETGVRPDNGEDPWRLLESFLLSPPLMTYGLDTNSDEGDLENFPPLAVALNWITHNLPIAEEDMGTILGVEDDKLDERRTAYNLLETIALELPRVACYGESLERLIIALGDTAVEGVSLPLGRLLAYAHQRTGNLFADTGYWEAEDMRTYGAWYLDWDGKTLDDLAAQQAEAREIASAFGHLDDRITAKPSRLVELGEQIAAAAEQLGMPVTWLGRDEKEEEHHNDRANEDEDEGGGALAAHREAAALAAA
jgi:hypothetical protein